MAIIKTAFPVKKLRLREWFVQVHTISKGISGNQIQVFLLPEATFSSLHQAALSSGGSVPQIGSRK